MNRLLGLLTFCVALAVLQALLVVLVAAALLALLYAFVTRPRDTIVFVATVGLVGLASVQPLAFILTAGALALGVTVVAAVTRRPQEQHNRSVLLLGQDAGSDG